MDSLKRNALVSLPMSEQEVLASYRRTAGVLMRRLCESHERLREELRGAEFMLIEDSAVIAKALAMTDTGSVDFRAAFPAKSAAEGINPTDYVPGWRVVEKIREILLKALPVQPDGTPR
jgi:hypothetical protein